MLPAASVMTLPPSARAVPAESVTERVFSIPCADPAEGHSTAVRAATTITEREGDNADSASRNMRRLSAQHGSPAREVGVVSAALATLHENSLYVSRRDESMADVTFSAHAAGRRPARCAHLGCQEECLGLNLSPPIPSPAYTSPPGRQGRRRVRPRRN